MSITGFTSDSATFNGIEIGWSIGGEGPPLLLLHGFPQTRALWAEIAPEMAKTHTVICPDLRGYGESGKPNNVSAYSFRAMAQDQTDLMDHLGFERFAVAGHDRGGRVAHRLCLDAPERVRRVCLMDIVPTHTLLIELHKDIAEAYYHWFFLAQPQPFPERMIGADPDHYFESCLLGWGSARLEDFDADQLEAYRKAWRDPDTIRGMCNDYRAALACDFEDDAADLEEKITCPALILYGADGIMGRHYDLEKTWDAKCTNMTSLPISGGHFFIDTNASDKISALQLFMLQR
ncbi:MAG: alpha/beta hydrolase [Pseudomonadota bacterium]